MTQKNNNSIRVIFLHLILTMNKQKQMRFRTKTSIVKITFVFKTKQSEESNIQGKDACWQISFFVLITFWFIDPVTDIIERFLSWLKAKGVNIVNTVQWKKINPLYPMMREVSLETLPNVNIRDPSHDKKNLPIMFQ